jgi:uncharacterized protein (TIGR02246 family)
MTFRSHTLPARAFVLCATVALLALAPACAPQAAPDTRAADESAIRAAEAQWAKAAGSKDVDATVAFYSDDAQFLPPNESRITGKKGIRDSWAAMLGMADTITWEPTKVEVASSGELGYVIGSYTLTMKDPKGATITDKGKILDVWKKQADGTWKCIADMYNTDTPLPAPPPEAKK